MLGKIKTAIQDRLYQNCMTEYQDAIRYQSDPYAMWIKATQKQEEGDEEKSYPSLSVVYMEQCVDNFCLEDVKNEYVLFVSQQGRIAVDAFEKIVSYLDEHKDKDIVYANEDIWMLTPDTEREPDNALLHRISPWMKPCWSPDTLLSFQYFGNVFAVRKSVFVNQKWLGDEDYQKNLYDFLLKATEQKTPGQLEDVLFHAYVEGLDRKDVEEKVMHLRNLWGAGAAFDNIRAKAFERRGLQVTQMKDDRTGYTYPIYQTNQNPLVSIIIPSKDNMEVLKQCIRSVYRLTEYKNFEIVVIDNGSSAQTRMSLEKFKEECPFVYLYQPMEFNFSKMCNIGAKQAKGEYILLLNDDMEVIQGSWLTRMVGHAALSYVGAVGAKLLYPNTTLIQHAGINNTYGGPGHKLKQLDDTKSYYYGRNTLIYNMIGVTGACLLMKRDKYIQLDGLYEGLRVAYNDVDLCFRAYEKGWHNVQRNDVVLYHHESLSRGDDMQDAEKLKRLHEELDVLYKRHPKLYRVDPYNADLVNSGEAEYECRMLETYDMQERLITAQDVKQGKKLPSEKHMNQAILIVVEECGKEKLPKDSKKKEYHVIKGWQYVPGADNARYEFAMLFRNEQGQVWEIPVKKKYRKDAAAILPNEMNVELTGFCCWLEEDALPKGKYEFWMTAKDMCSRQRLHRNTNQILTIE